MRGILLWFDICGFLLCSVLAVDIASFETHACTDYDEMAGRCEGHPANLCCGFPSRITATSAVGWAGLAQGDFATWFFPGNQDALGGPNYCGGMRRAQVVIGRGSQDLCMIATDDPHGHWSNDGANW
jgi:hypothetical protein